jgi:hypothetical protein
MSRNYTSSPPRRLHGVWWGNFSFAQNYAKAEVPDTASDGSLILQTMLHHLASAANNTIVVIVQMVEVIFYCI